MDKKFVDWLIKMNETGMHESGYENVKAIAFEGSVDYTNDPLIKEMERDGWKIKDENMFGDGTGCGTILVFVK